MKHISNELGFFIESMIGIEEVKYLGIQEGFAGYPSFLIFHDMKTKTSVCARGLRELIKNVQNSREKFKQFKKEVQ
jgi:hypothetical protein